MIGEIEAQSICLDIIQKCLTNTIYEDPPQDKWSGGKYNSKIRDRGLDWPSKSNRSVEDPPDIETSSWGVPSA